MIRIAIVDDSREMVNVIEQLIKKSLKKCIGELEFRKYAKPILLKYDLEEKEQYDIFILDIEMPEMNGLELAKYIRATREDAYIIFLTSHMKYAVHSYDFSIRAYQYILKNKMSEMLPVVLERIIEKCREQEDQFYIIKTQVRFTRIRHRDIIHIYKDGKNTVFATQKENYRERESMERVLDKLGSDSFILIERGNIVNIEHIETIKRNEIYMDNGRVLEISRPHIKAVKQRVNRYWRNNL